MNKLLKLLRKNDIIVNKISGVPFPYSNYYHRQIIWFKTLNKSEIIKAIRMDYLFSCIILKDGSDFHEYDYAIEQFETDDGMAMSIGEKEKGSFEKYIYPKMCKKYIL